MGREGREEREERCVNTRTGKNTVIYKLCDCLTGNIQKLTKYIYG